MGTRPTATPRVRVGSATRAGFVSKVVEALCRGALEASISGVALGTRVEAELTPPAGAPTAVAVTLMTVFVRSASGEGGHAWLAVVDGMEESLRRLVAALDRWDAQEPGRTATAAHSRPSQLLARSPPANIGLPKQSAPLARHEFERRLRSNTPLVIPSGAEQSGLRPDQRRALDLVAHAPRLSSLMISARDWLPPGLLIDLLYSCHLRGVLEFARTGGSLP